MIRPFTCVCMLLAAGSGLYLYQTKHTAQMLDREIIRTAKAADAVRERTGVLKAEWALLQEPERLTELSSQHLGLKALDPKQFVAVADLASRLPAPLPPGSMLTPAAEIPIAASEEPVAKPAPLPQTKIAALPPKAAPAQAVAQIAAAPAVPPAKPVQMADATPVPPKPAAPAAPAAVMPKVTAAAKPALPAPVPMPQSRIMAPVMSVSAQPMGTAPAHGVPRVQGLTAPQVPMTIGESVARASRGNTANETAATPAYAAAPAPVFASALGSAHGTLPPPVPYSTR